MSRNGTLTRPHAPRGLWPFVLITSAALTSGCHRTKAYVPVTNDTTPISPDAAADDAMADHSVVNMAQPNAPSN